MGERTIEQMKEILREHARSADTREVDKQKEGNLSDTNLQRGNDCVANSKRTGHGTPQDDC